MAGLQYPDISETLNLNIGWGLSEHGFALILELLNKSAPPRSILEFGSGCSTIRFSLAFPESAILSLESDWLGFGEVERLRERLGRENAITLRYCPLVPHSYGDGEVFSYQSEPLVHSGRFDCLIIDGPPFYVLRGREICLYQAYASLETGGFVILDDFYRKAEQITVSNWLSVYPDSFTPPQVLDSSHGIAVLQKIREVTPNWQAESLKADRQKISARRRRVRDALTHIDDSEWLFYRDRLKNTATTGRFLGMINIIRDCHGVPRQQIEKTINHDAMLSDTERKSLLDNCFRVLQDELRE
ncbi:MAG: hypothetical protein WA738_19810 [Candidatus Angelobacter sp.]